jgi:hypothetical protein
MPDPVRVGNGTAAEFHHNHGKPSDSTLSVYQNVLEFIRKYGRIQCLTQGIGVYLCASTWAHFCVPGTQKPGFPLQFLGIVPQFLRYFRCNPLRGRKLEPKTGALMRMRTWKRRLSGGFPAIRGVG